MGHHARVLDLLHVSDSAFVCGACTWHGSSRILEGGINAENALGEIRFLEASVGFGVESAAVSGEAYRNEAGQEIVKK